MPKNFKTKLKTKTAWAKLQAALDRAAIWNECHAEWCRIENIVLVGSLARNEDRVSDIDLCIETRRVAKASFDELDLYFGWRELCLGYAMPRDARDEYAAIYDGDAYRFVKNRDGRFDLLGWDQFEVISLTLNPSVYLLKGGKCRYKDVRDAVGSAKPISMNQARQLIERNILGLCRPSFGDEWDSYCQTVMTYPEEIRDIVLARDNNVENFERYLLNHQ